MKFFLPDWEDRIDPGFDFIKDKYSKEHLANKYNNDVYAHELFKKVPYDGLLFSLSVFKSKIYLKEQNGTSKVRDHTDIRRYLRVDNHPELTVLGDCGAFGYVSKPEPPKPFYDVKNVARLYHELNFDYGVSVDHLVVDFFMAKDKNGKKKKHKLSKKEKESRIKITLDNAQYFLELHSKNKYNYVPIGVAQGYNVNTYRHSIKELLQMGYSYIGLGGLVQYNSTFIINLLKRIRPLTKGKKLHLFGVLRPNDLRTFHELGVTSFDSASFFRKAWLRSGQNYLATNGKWYAAIRVPQSTNPRFLRMAENIGYSLSALKKMEKNVLSSIRQYEKRKIGLDIALKKILEYDRILLRNTADEKNLEERYRVTLSERPWEVCTCEICKEIGIDVVIFRGCNRNKRRGFHNNWVFNNSYLRLL